LARVAESTTAQTGRAAPPRFIAYERVSTARQGASGLGIEAQRHSIATSRSADVIARFTEVESGRNPHRPELTNALHLSKITGATLVIAKLDRLSRNAAFLLTLRDSGVKFLAVDLPEANDLTVGIMALVAQAEREAVSRRTKEALAVAKARGVRLGNPNGAEALRRAGRGAVALRAAVVGNADRHAEDLRAVVEDIKSEGMVSLRAIAAALNARGMLTRRGGPWQVSNVGNLVRRLEAGRSTEPKSIGVRGDERSGRTEKPDTRLQS
jgi:DNA invertase Pin-like site-specific DNA recombinase